MQLRNRFIGRLGKPEPAARGALYRPALSALIMLFMSLLLYGPQPFSAVKSSHTIGWQHIMHDNIPSHAIPIQPSVPNRHSSCRNRLRQGPFHPLPAATCASRSLRPDPSRCVPGNATKARSHMRSISEAAVVCNLGQRRAGFH